MVPTRSSTGLSPTVVQPLAVREWSARTFGAGRSRIDDEFSLQHFRDLTALHGVPLTDPPRAREGTTFVTMAAALLDGMGRCPEVDLAVVAHATPDLDCRLSVVTYLADALPGQPTTFTITDCGDAPVHTLLRVVGAHARRHGARRALALLFDQATLPYDTGRNLAGDAAVALLLDDADGGGEVGLSDVLDVPPEDVPSVLDAFLANLPPSATVVAGPGLAGVVDPGHPGRVVRVRPGFPATGGVTAALRAGADDIVLLDHELGRRELRVCRLRWGV